MTSIFRGGTELVTKRGVWTRGVLSAQAVDMLLAMPNRAPKTKWVIRWFMIVSGDLFLDEQSG